MGTLNRLVEAQLVRDGDELHRLLGMWVSEEPPHILRTTAMRNYTIIGLTTEAHATKLGIIEHMFVLPTSEAYRKASGWYERRIYLDGIRRDPPQVVRNDCA